MYLVIYQMTEVFLIGETNMTLEEKIGKCFTTEHNILITYDDDEREALLKAGFEEIGTSWIGDNIAYAFKIVRQVTIQSSKITDNKNVTMWESIMNNNHTHYPSMYKATSASGIGI